MADNEVRDMERFVPPGTMEMAPVPINEDQTGIVRARIQADVMVRTQMAIARPRDLDVVRERLLKDARRPGFAETAEYSVPRGGSNITGPSIRFVESALSALGNITTDVTVLNESEDQRFCEVTIADLERNTVFRQGFVVNKTIERRKLPDRVKQEDIIGTRVNAEGQMLYIMKAPESEVAMKQGAAASKIIRTLGLRLLPGDIKEEALDLCTETRRSRDAADPDAARKKLADAFATLGVKVMDLKEYLGHPLDQSSPAEIDALRKLYTSLKEGVVTWVEVTGQSDKAADAIDPSKKAADVVKAKLAGTKATIMTAAELEAAERAYQVELEQKRAANENGGLV